MLPLPYPASLPLLALTRSKELKSPETRFTYCRWRRSYGLELPEKICPRWKKGARRMFPLRFEKPSRRRLP
jgi:hypothetical protein